MRRFIAAVLLALSLPLPAPAALPELTLYSALSYGSAIARAFTRETGIPVRVVPADGAAVLAHIEAQGAHPHWSVAWFNGAAAAAALDERGLLAHGLPEPSNLAPDAAPLMPASGAWVPTGVTLAALFIRAADPYVAPPPDWQALTGSAYHGILGMPDPGITAGAYDALAGLLRQAGGWPQGQAFLTELKRDGLHIYASQADTLAALRSGSIALAILPSPIAFAAASRDSALRLAIPKPIFLRPSVLVMALNLPPARRAAAERFIAFANTERAEAIRMQQGTDAWYWPVTRHPPHPGLPPLASLAPTILDPATWGRLQPSILRWFDRVMVGN